MRRILAGVRPVALTAVSERERLRAHPHRAQAAVNHARAIEAAHIPADEDLGYLDGPANVAAELSGIAEKLDTAPAKKRRKR